MREIRMFAACAGAALVAGAASAGVVEWTFGLDGSQEVPAVATPATGQATVTLNTVTGEVTVDGTFQDLIGESTVAHIHGPAPAGVNAGILLDLVIPAGVHSGTITGMGTLTMAQVDDMLAGLHYINVHSTMFPPGEIRGQIIPAPGAAGLLALAGLAAARRRR